MTRPPTIVAFVEEWLGLALSTAQRTLLKAIYGLLLTAEELDIFQACTGRSEYMPPSGGYRDTTIIAGARGGKDSRIACPIVVYEAVFGAWAVTKGERPVIPLIAQNADSGRVAFEYCEAYLETPALRAMLAGPPRRSEIELTNGVLIRIFPCSSKAVRGRSNPVAVMDEVAFFRIEGGAQADRRVERALRRGMLSFPSGRLIKISTPDLREGLIWDDLARYWGQIEAPLLVWKASTDLMNPALAAQVAAERAKDPHGARVEYDAEFAADAGAFLPLDQIEAVVERGRYELPPRPGVRYIAAGDPAGGTAGGDAFALAIVHVEGTGAETRIVQDVCRSWKGRRGEMLELRAVCAEIAAILRHYGVTRLTGDRYAGVWPSQAFRDVGALYVPSERDKSAAYTELEPWISTGRLELLDHDRQTRELSLLEKRLKPGGKKPTIDHPKGAHDDHANALALAVADLASSLHPAATVTESVVAKFGDAAVLHDPPPTGGFFGTRRAPVRGQLERVGVASADGSVPREVWPRRARFWR
jgi:pimeloyl-ACP methyl ester carboxylesterase